MGGIDSTRRRRGGHGCTALGPVGIGRGGSGNSEIASRLERGGGDGSEWMVDGAGAGRWMRWHARRRPRCRSNDFLDRCALNAGRFLREEHDKLTLSGSVLARVSRNFLRRLHGDSYMVSSDP